MNEIISLFDDQVEQPVYHLAYIDKRDGLDQVFLSCESCDIFTYSNFNELKSDIENLKKENILLLFGVCFRGGKIEARYSIISIYKRSINHNDICNRRIKCLERNKKLTDLLN